MDLKNSFIDWLLKKSFWHGDFRCLILDILKTRKKKKVYLKTQTKTHKYWNERKKNLD